MAFPKSTGQARPAPGDEPVLYQPRSRTTSIDRDDFVRSKNRSWPSEPRLRIATPMWVGRAVVHGSCFSLLSLRSTHEYFTIAGSIGPDRFHVLWPLFPRPSVDPFFRPATPHGYAPSNERKMFTDLPDPSSSRVYAAAPASRRPIEALRVERTRGRVPEGDAPSKSRHPSAPTLAGVTVAKRERLYVHIE